ncbi:Tetratricopeptide-like helical [Niveomyces insectorum RCEF 264]|uniref:Tetratricopeptide-like helical n=1 Tax=Niveomyces insectorum RCEF 264 TaxID=1081102 RepID=A0A167NSM3_9HYPO|nr:Tetratricopeptide-like helical [Niveomyces insectorum RCEF 264]
MADRIYTATTDTAWMAPSLAAARSALPILQDARYSDDASLLLLLLSHLAASERVPLALLFRGASPRRRWTLQGEVDDVDALPQACREFWKQQALIVAYRAVPWKYLETINTETPLFLPHLHYTLEASRSTRFAHLPPETRVDLALTLVEAARFPGMGWKRYVVAQAEAVADTMPTSRYLDMCIAQIRCVLAQISGDLGEAMRGVEAAVANNAGEQASVDTRLHAATGYALIQKALTYIQEERLDKAEECLENWHSKDPERPSALESVVLFRQSMIWGRFLRFRGDFVEARARLREAQEQQRNQSHRQLISLDEELQDFTCDLADTLRELNELEEAEQCLRTEIELRHRRQNDENRALSPVDTTLLNLSLAEVMFARGRFQDAKDLCLAVLSHPRPLRFTKLRAHIVLAKTRHVQGDHVAAFQFWTEALKDIAKFPFTYGYTTQVIIASAKDSMGRLGHIDLVTISQKQLDGLSLRVVPQGAMQHWIAGMSQWQAYVLGQTTH